MNFKEIFIKELLSETLTEAKPKLGVIIVRDRNRTNRWVGTVEELTQSFSYSLEVGASWSHEKGNKKVNRNPKSVKTLANELIKALDNTGNSRPYGYEFDKATPEEFARYAEEGSFSQKI